MDNHVDSPYHLFHGYKTEDEKGLGSIKIEYYKIQDASVRLQRIILSVHLFAPPANSSCLAKRDTRGLFLGNEFLKKVKIETKQKHFHDNILTVQRCFRSF